MSETDGVVVKKDVKTKIDEERRNELAQEVVGHTRRYRDLEDEKKAATKDLTAKMKQERADWERKAEAIATGILEEQVECTQHFDFSRNEVAFRRIDTGEVVATRAMTQGERQLSIDGVDDDKPSAPVVPIDAGKPKKRLRSVAADESETH